jgi:hypothetical protein
MANDQSIELRVSLQERQMETLVEIVEEIRTNYLTRSEFKEALAQQRVEFKDALNVQKAEFRAYIDERLSHYATKEDLERMRQDTRNWMITLGISLVALQFTMQFAFFQLYIHLR